MSLVEPVVQWYEKAARPLPWRATECSPWGVLVSEVMLQQTQVDRVIPVWQAWLDRWPRPADLAAAPLDEVLRHWGRLGYPRRARWLWQAAQRITEAFGGEVPSDEHQLRQLPGIGAYTAAAVCAFAFGQGTVVLDTNVRRVLARVLHGQAFPVPHITQAERAAAAALLPEHHPARWSVAVMELGALVCTAQRPACERCPLVTVCAWRAADYPTPSVRRRSQAAYRGSDREARGAILDRLRNAPANAVELMAAVTEPDRLERALTSLTRDGLITASDGRYHLGTTHHD